MGKKCQNPGASEKAEVLEWILQGRPEKVPRPDFTAYKGADVVTALEKLFHHKCAYCESLYGLVHPVDVEHWRPKSEVWTPGSNGKKWVARHGYEWLAMEWSNLLPSCIDCNRARGQRNEKDEDQVMGKGNHFPVRDEAFRAKFPADLVHERPLLLNPCEDNPSDYLRFDDRGAVRPLENLPPEMSERAVASIEVYGLNRRALVDERVRHLRWLELEFQVMRFLFEVSGNVQLGEAMCNIATNLFRQALDRLRERMEADQPYSACLAQHLRSFLAEEFCQ